MSTIAAPVAAQTARSSEVVAVMVVRDEPLGRVQRAVDALAVQRGVEPFAVVIAAPWTDLERLRSIQPQGTVRALIFVENPEGARSAGLNAAVGSVTAEIVVRVDARSVVRDDYVARCVARLRQDRTVGVVGGVQRPEAYSGGIRDRGIARALRNHWLLGNAAYRRAGSGGATDTVYLGAFRKGELVDLGGYDERLDANEDFDLCARFRSEGRVVWLDPDLVVGYEPRSSLVDLTRQYHAFGAAKVRFWRATGRCPNTRQVVALAAGAAGGIALAAAASKPRRLAVLGMVGVAAIATLDHLAEPHERDPRVRAHSWGANVAVMAGWLSGVVRELAHGVRARLR